MAFKLHQELICIESIPDGEIGMHQINLTYFNSFFQQNNKISIWTEQKIEKNFLFETIKFIEENQVLILDSALNALFEKYPKWRNEYGYEENELQIYMPEVTAINDFSHILDPMTIVIHKKNEKFNFGFGLIFDCQWDEHGIGVAFNDYDVVKIGNSDVAM